MREIVYPLMPVSPLKLRAAENPTAASRPTRKPCQSEAFDGGPMLKARYERCTWYICTMPRRPAFAADSSRYMPRGRPELSLVVAI